MKLDDYWPKSLQHLSGVYDDGISDDVTIALIDDGPHDGYSGYRKVSTALVPLEIVDEVLATPGSVGWEVESWGPRPVVDSGRAFDTSFWIQGRSREEKFQTVLNAWKHHNQEVILPDSVLLMTYGLVPRFLESKIVCWDDPARPVYDVVRAQSHVDYNKKSTRPLVQITIRRDYLEDYCHLKRCAAVAVYYEERYATEDSTILGILKNEEGRTLKLPGRELTICNLRNNEYHKSTPFFSRVWGSRLILKPKARPISDEQDPRLVWPDHQGVMTLGRASNKWLYGYVSDSVLEAYEGRSEFLIHPESGGVSYGGWWAVSYCNRIGRGHIRIELKKLYEGCPPSVISHWHRHSVSEASAENDLKEHGNRNVARRAEEVLESFLQITAALARLSDRFEAGFSQEEFGGLASADVAYSGWWTLEVMKPISYVVRPDASEQQFLGRVVSIFKLVEMLKPAPIRNIALKIGVPAKKLSGFGSLKLLAVLCQLCETANSEGLDISSDSVQVVEAWNSDSRLQPFVSIFALNMLRDLASHASSGARDRELAKQAELVGIDVSDTRSGWGLAIDRLFDHLIDDLNKIATILKRV